MHNFILTYKLGRITSKVQKYTCLGGFKLENFGKLGKTADKRSFFPSFSLAQNTLPLQDEETIQL